MSRVISICIATYRRPAMLARLLAAIASCRIPSDSQVEVRVVDNDSDSSALGVFTSAVHPGMRFVYVVESRRGIAHARNAAVEVATSDVLVFVDDDEVVPVDWLTSLVGALDATGVDAVVGPVRGVCPWHAPAWIVRGGFFDKPTAQAGLAMHWRGGRTSNTAFHGRWFYERGIRFNTAFGLSGAEDTEVFLQMSRCGARFAGAPDAWISEDVEADRVNFAWLWRRHLRGGRNYRRLCDLAGGSQSELVLCAARCARGAFRAATGLPDALRGRPENTLKGVMQFAVALGGLDAWLKPSAATARCEYPERRLETN